MPTISESFNELGEISHLKDFFPKATNVTNFRMSCANISGVLSGGPSTVAFALKALENRIVNEIKRRLNTPQAVSTAESYYKELSAGYKDAADTKKESKPDFSAQPMLNHLVTDILCESESKAGFAVQQRTDQVIPVPMYIAQLDAKTFSALADEGRQFKDVGVSPFHGELTHRLQWYVVSQIRSIPHPLKELFIAIQKSPQKTGVLASGLWDYLFDRLSAITGGINVDSFSAKSEMDFRSPENFLKYLTGSAKEVCPVLSAFLKARQEKRRFEFLDAPEGMAGLYYLAWKNYSKPYTQLKGEEADSLFIHMANLGGAIKKRSEKILAS